MSDLRARIAAAFATAPATAEGCVVVTVPGSATGALGPPEKAADAAGRIEALAVVIAAAVEATGADPARDPRPLPCPLAGLDSTTSPPAPLRVCKGEPIAGREDVPTVTLVIGDKIPDGRDPEERCDRPNEAIYKRDAERVRTALRCLPQGTRYQLLLLMLEDAPVFYRGR